MITQQQLTANPRIIPRGRCAVVGIAGRVLTFHHLARAHPCLWCGRRRRVVLPIVSGEYVRWWLCAPCAPLAIAAIDDNRPLFNISPAAAAKLRYALMTESAKNAHLAASLRVWQG